MISFTARLFDSAIDVDDIGFYAQAIGGYFEVHRGTEVEFFIPQEYRDFMIIKYPLLTEVAYVY
jgi:hypothetical protein